jgi:hypothetical protein
LSRNKSKKRTRKPNLPEEVYRVVKTKEETSLSAEGNQRGFNPDYSYVRKDLKRIALLAGFFIILLVVLSFYLR